MMGVGLIVGVAVGVSLAAAVVISSTTGWAISAVPVNGILVAVANGVGGTAVAVGTKVAVAGVVGVAGDGVGVAAVSGSELQPDKTINIRKRKDHALIRILLPRLPVKVLPNKQDAGRS